MLILLNIALEIALIALIVNIVATIIVEIVLEVEAVVACYAKLDTCTFTIASNVVIDRIRVSLVVGNNSWSIERVVKLKHQIWRPLRVTNVVFGHEA